MRSAHLAALSLLAAGMAADIRVRSRYMICPISITSRTAAMATLIQECRRMKRRIRRRRVFFMAPHDIDSPTGPGNPVRSGRTQ